MEFRIRHEKIASVIIFILSFLLLGALTFAFITMNMPAPYLLCGLFLQLVVIIVFAAVQLSSTVITIEGRNVIINYVFAKKTISIDEISDVQISRYKRWHKNHYIEQRMRMAISLYGKKDIVLNDTAMAHTPVLGVLASRDDVLPDEEVVLYQVYQIIMSQMS